jgi:5-methylcytosine-specific restriction protein A
VELAPRGQTRCDAHERARDRARGSAHARGYDARWRRYRRSYLAAHPLCVRCLAEGRVEPATVVHHKVPHKGDEKLFWDPTNHEGVCEPHHNAVVDEGDFGR